MTTETELMDSVRYRLFDRLRWEREDNSRRASRAAGTAVQQRLDNLNRIAVEHNRVWTWSQGMGSFRIFTSRAMEGQTSFDEGDISTLCSYEDNPEARLVAEILAIADVLYEDFERQEVDLG